MRRLVGFIIIIIIIITRGEEVMFSSALVSLFVCLQDYAKTTQRISTKFGGFLAHGTRQKPLDFGGNPDHVTLALGWV